MKKEAKCLFNTKHFNIISANLFKYNIYEIFYVGDESQKNQICMWDKGGSRKILQGEIELGPLRVCC